MPSNQTEKPSFLKKFLMIIGVITIVFIFLVILILVLLFAYLMVNKPLGLEINPFSKTETTYDHPLLSTEQEKTLQTLGVNVESLPTSITPTQEQCTTDALGQTRVNEIKAGAAPSISDYLKAKGCF